MKEGFFIQARSIANKAQECRDDDEEKSYYLSNSEKYKLLRTIFFFEYFLNTTHLPKKDFSYKLDPLQTKLKNVATIMKRKSYYLSNSLSRNLRQPSCNRWFQIEKSLSFTSRDVSARESTK
jgi:hypothetical protein